jgi:hypothetical protein
MGADGRVVRGLAGSEEPGFNRVAAGSRGAFYRGARGAAEGCAGRRAGGTVSAQRCSPGRKAQRRAPGPARRNPAPPRPAHRAAPARRGGPRLTLGSRRETRSSASASWPRRRGRRNRRGPAGREGPRPPPASPAPAVVPLCVPPSSSFFACPREPRLTAPPGPTSGHRCHRSQS